MPSNSLIKSGYLVPMFAITLALMAVTFLAATSFSGQAQAANSGNTGVSLADGAVFVGGLAESGDGAVYHTIMEGDVQVSQWADLVMDVSLECGLVTDTKVKSQKGKVDTSTAEAGVMVRVEITDLSTGAVRYAMPGRRLDYSGGIVYCKRIQEQIAKLGGILEVWPESGGSRVSGYTWGQQV